MQFVSKLHSSLDGDDNNNENEKSVLHYVASDPFWVFKDNEAAQYDMLLTLINDYHVDESIIATDDGNHVNISSFRFSSS